jgi:hypothetical protein
LHSQTAEEGEPDRCDQQSWWIVGTGLDRRVERKFGFASCSFAGLTDGILHATDRRLAVAILLKLHGDAQGSRCV